MGAAQETVSPFGPAFTYGETEARAADLILTSRVGIESPGL